MAVHTVFMAEKRFRDFTARDAVPVEVRRTVTWNGVFLLFQRR